MKKPLVVMTLLGLAEVLVGEGLMLSSLHHFGHRAAAGAGIFAVGWTLLLLCVFVAARQVRR